MNYKQLLILLASLFFLTNIYSEDIFSILSEKSDDQDLILKKVKGQVELLDAKVDEVRIIKWNGNYNEKEITPLSLAVENNHYGVIEYLVNKGANINRQLLYKISSPKKDEKQRICKFTVLNLALYKEYFSLTIQLMDLGASPTIGNELPDEFMYPKVYYDMPTLDPTKKYNFLDQAIVYEKLNYYNYLIDRFKDIKPMQSVLKNNQLFWIIINNDFDGFKTYLKEGRNVGSYIFVLIHAKRFDFIELLDNLGQFEYKNFGEYASLKTLKDIAKIWEISDKYFFKYLENDPTLTQEEENDIYDNMKNINFSVEEITDALIKNKMNAGFIIKPIYNIIEKIRDEYYQEKYNE